MLKLFSLGTVFEVGLQQEFPKVPIMVLTATATEKCSLCFDHTDCRVRDDVLKLLRLSPPRLKTFIMSFNRPNLHYEVVYKAANEDPYPQILKMIKEFNENRSHRLASEGKGNLEVYPSQAR